MEVIHFIWKCITGLKKGEDEIEIDAEGKEWEKEIWSFSFICQQKGCLISFLFIDKQLKVNQNNLVIFITIFIFENVGNETKITKIKS